MMLNCKNHIALFVFVIGFSNIHFLPLSAQEKIYQTQKNNPSQIVIDGIIDEASWDLVEWENNFTQREPYEGEAPSQITAFKILYDDNNLYIAIRANDTQPDKIERRLTRRDAYEGDLVGVNIDSYNDKLTAFEFTVNAAGVKNDGLISNDSDKDITWNPVWYVKTSTDDSGWTAEMKIPFTQLRFPEKENYQWGFQVFRWLFRKEEASAWVHIPKEEARWVSLFGELQGISNIKPKKEIELIPYAMGNLETYKQEEDNPLRVDKILDTPWIGRQGGRNQRPDFKYCCKP
ncbi:MAG: carbohydrate binding family 9 domain-containing protein [Bacteroidales bacterium]